jgi:hypothetical protein
MRSSAVSKLLRMRSGGQDALEFVNVRPLGHPGFATTGHSFFATQTQRTKEKPLQQRARCKEAGNTVGPTQLGRKWLASRRSIRHTNVRVLVSGAHGGSFASRYFSIMAPTRWLGKFPGLGSELAHLTVKWLVSQSLRQRRRGKRGLVSVSRGMFHLAQFNVCAPTSPPHI